MLSVFVPEVWSHPISSGCNEVRRHTVKTSHGRIFCRDRFMSREMLGLRMGTWVAILVPVMANLRKQKLMKAFLFPVTSARHS